MVSISIPSELLTKWFNETTRYTAIWESEAFKSELHSAYVYIEKKADNRVKIGTEQDLSVSAQRCVMVGLAKAAAEAYFSGKTLAEAEKATISNPEWISEQITLARNIAWTSIQVRIWEKNRENCTNINYVYASDEGEGCWND